MILLSFCADCTWSILPFLLGAWLLGWLFWWLFNRSRYQGLIAASEEQIQSWKNRSNQFETDLASTKYEHEKLNKEYQALRSKYNDNLIQLKACEEQRDNMESAVAAATPPLTNAQQLVEESDTGGGGFPINFAAAFKSDNLQVVEGIGPKIEQLLKDHDINQWSVLAATSRSRLKEILESAGSRYRVHDPGSWPEQARLAQSGEWQKLIDYQAYLGGGREDSKTGGGDAKVQMLAAKLLGIPLYQADDLKVVEGIGPKIESLLKNAGIQDWKQLSETEVDRIQQILTAAGERYRLADPTTWPEQARMAHQGEWKTLHAYQEELKGGKKA